MSAMTMFVVQAAPPLNFLSACRRALPDLHRDGVEKDERDLSFRVARDGDLHDFLSFSHGSKSPPVETPERKTAVKYKSAFLFLRR